ncbi:diacylglycerol/lipid kinase family protein [Patescibacteria group bacterium]
MKILIIYNPFSGKKSHKDKQIKNWLKKLNFEADWHYTTQGSFDNLDPDHYDRIFVAGGDGTVKETASWIINKKSNTPLAIIPVGSANILALSSGIPLDTKKAINLGLTDKIQKIDVGIVNNKHYFLVAAGCGFDAKVIKNTSRKMKKTWGWLAYLVGLITSFFSSKSNKFFIKIDDQSQTVNAQSIFISNFTKFFNFNLNPKAQINDGLLNVSILNTLNIKDLTILLPRLLMRKYKKDWRYQYETAKEIYVLPFNNKTPIQIDGEVVDLPYLDIKILPQVLKIIANKLP